MYPLNKPLRKQEFSLQKAKSIPCKQGAVRNVKFNVDGNYCITCGSDKSLKLWNPLRSFQIQTYSGHGYEVLDACGSSDNSQIASCGMDKVVFIWDVSTAVAVRKFRGHAAQINTVKYNEESSVVISGSLDGTVRAWDLKSNSKDPIQIMKEAKDSVTSIQVSDHEILTGSLDGIIRLYDLRKGKMAADKVGKPVTCVNFTHDGQCLLASCMDDTVRLIDKDNGVLLAKYQGHKNSKYKVESTLNCTDAQVLSGSEDGNVYCWDLLEGNLITKLEHEDHKVVHSVTFHPNQQILVTAAEGSIFVWLENPGDKVT